MQYLNAQPLIYGYPGPVVFDHPSALARDLAAGAARRRARADFRGSCAPRDYRLVDGVAIASDGPVFSVFLAHRGPLSEIRRIALDPASLTSVHLLQVLLAECHGLRPECISADAPAAADCDAMLLIGNQAIEFRHTHPADYQFLDLGEEWQRQTGLPFVYAPWLMRQEVPNAQAAADELRRLGREGVARVEEIIAREKFQDAPFRRRYLTEHIRFELGIRERAGMERFRELLVKHGFLPENREPLVFV